MEFEKGRDLLEAALEGARLRRRRFDDVAGVHCGLFAVVVLDRIGSIGATDLGTVVIAGMLADTLIASFLIPVSFYVVEKFSTALRPQAPGTATRVRRLRSAREAGGSIKPGAQAPGSLFRLMGAEPAKRATAQQAY